MSIALMLTASFIVTFYLVRKTIWISHKTGLYDHPSEDRKIHKDSTPHLGGAAIFLGILGMSALFPTLRSLPEANVFYFTTGFLFLTGIGDDLAGMNPYKKLLAQAVSAVTLALHPAYRITQLQDVFGIGYIDGIPSFLLTVLFILAAVNAFNLVDGINCLASGLAIAGITSLAFCFHLANQPEYLALCAVLFGGVLAFMLHNRTPAKIFLGDSGSLVLGFLLSALSIRLFESRNNINPAINPAFYGRIPLLVMAVFFIPFLDMTRVFIVRLGKKRSPFSADRSHIHHRLLDMGMSHMQASSLLVGFSFLAQVAAVTIPHLSLPLFLIILLSAMGLLYWVLNWQSRQASSTTTGQPVGNWPSEETMNHALSGPYPQFIKYFIARRNLDKNYQPKKMQEMEQVEVPVK